MKIFSSILFLSTTHLAFGDDLPCSIKFLTFDTGKTLPQVVTGLTIKPNNLASPYVGPTASGDLYIIPLGSSINWRVTRPYRMGVNVRYTCEKAGAAINYYMPFCGDVNGDGVVDSIDSDAIDSFLKQNFSSSKMKFIAAGNVGFVYKNADGIKYPNDVRDFSVSKIDSDNIRNKTTFTNLKYFSCEEMVSFPEVAGVAKSGENIRFGSYNYLKELSTCGDQPDKEFLLIPSTASSAVCCAFQDSSLSAEGRCVRGLPINPTKGISIQFSQQNNCRVFTHSVDPSDIVFKGWIEKADRRIDILDSSDKILGRHSGILRPFSHHDPLMGEEVYTVPCYKTATKIKVFAESDNSLICEKEINGQEKCL